MKKGENIVWDLSTEGKHNILESLKDKLSLSGHQLECGKDRTIINIDSYEHTLLRWSVSDYERKMKLKEGAAEPQEVCEWKYFFTSFYGTSCNNFDMMMGKYKFCPYCGKPIKEVF